MTVGSMSQPESRSIGPVRAIKHELAPRAVMRKGEAEPGEEVVHDTHDEKVSLNIS